MTTLRIVSPPDSEQEGQPKTTVRRVVEEYLEDQRGDLAASSYADRERVGRLFCEAFGERQLPTRRDPLTCELRPSEVRRWINSQPQWAKENTRWGVLLILKRVFNWAAKDGLILPPSPLDALSLPQGDRRRETTEEEFQLMLGHSPAEFRRWLIFIRATGCRPGEACKVRWEWVDWSNRLIVIPKDEHKTGRKTRRPRLIPLPGPAWSLLLWLRRRCQAKGEIFRNSRGSPWTHTSAGQHLAAIRAASGLPMGATFHGIRHLVCTIGVKRLGGNLQAIGGVVGHTKSATTERYVHVAEDAKYLLETAEQLAKRTPRRPRAEEGTKDRDPAG